MFFLKKNGKNSKKNVRKSKKTLKKQMGGNNIPKKVHQIWFGDDIPELKLFMFTNVASICVKHGYDYKLWTNKDRTEANFPKTFEYQEKSIEEGKKVEQNRMAQVSDLCRLEIVHREGGIYLDSNFVIKDDFFRELQEKTATFIGANEDPGLRKYLSNSFFAATPGHPVLTRLLDEKKLKSIDFQSVHLNKTTGPYYLRSGIENASDDGVVLIDTEKIYPYPMTGSERGHIDNPCITTDVDGVEDKIQIDSNRYFLKKCSTLVPESAVAAYMVGLGGSWSWKDEHNSELLPPVPPSAASESELFLPPPPPPPPTEEPPSQKVCIIFDIDETLIHYIKKIHLHFWNELDEEKQKKFRFEHGSILFRPHIEKLFDYFKENRKHISVGLWTYSEREYAEYIAEILTEKLDLDPDFFLFKYGAEDINEEEDDPKDLRKVWRNFPQFNTFNTILVDDLPTNVYHKTNRANSILIQPFSPFGTHDLDTSKQRQSMTEKSYRESIDDTVFIELILIIKKLLKDINGCDEEEYNEALTSEPIGIESRIKRMGLKKYFKKYIIGKTKEEIHMMTIGKPMQKENKFQMKGGRKTKKKYAYRILSN